MPEISRIDNSDTGQNTKILPVGEESLIQDKKKETRVDVTSEMDVSTVNTDLDASLETLTETSQPVEENKEFQERESRIRQLEIELDTIKKKHLQEMEQNRKEITELKVLSGIKDAAVRCGFIDPAEAALHLKDVFRISGDEISFKGRRIKDSDLGKVIVAAVRTLSDTKPHLIRFESKSGSGVLKTGTVVEALVSRRDFSDPKTKREYEEELKKRGIQPLNPV